MIDCECIEEYRGYHIETWYDNEIPKPWCYLIRQGEEQIKLGLWWETRELALAAAKQWVEEL